MMMADCCQADCRQRPSASAEGGNRRSRPFGLVPVRDGSMLRSGRSGGILPSHSSSGEEAFILGRKEFLMSLHIACGCRSAAGRVEGGGKETPPRPPLCRRCQQTEDWACRYLSRRMVRLRTMTDEGAAFCVQVRGENAPDLVWVDGRRVVGGDAAENSRGEGQSSGKSDEEGWMGDAVLSAGSILALGFREDAAASIRYVVTDEVECAPATCRVARLPAKQNNRDDKGAKNVSKNSTGPTLALFDNEPVAGHVAPALFPETATKVGNLQKAKMDQKGPSEAEEQEPTKSRILDEGAKRQVVSIGKTRTCGHDAVPGQGQKSEGFVMSSQPCKNDSDSCTAPPWEEDSGKTSSPSATKRGIGSEVVLSSVPPHATGDPEGAAGDKDQGTALARDGDRATVGEDAPVSMAHGNDSAKHCVQVVAATTVGALDSDMTASRDHKDETAKILCGDDGKGDSGPAATLTNQSLVGKDVEASKVGGKNQTCSVFDKNTKADKATTAQATMASASAALVPVVDLCSPPPKLKSKSGGTSLISGAEKMERGENAHAEVIDVCESGDDDKRPKSPPLSLRRTGTLKTGNLSPSKPAATDPSATTQGQSKKPSVLLLQLGRSMSSSRVQILRSMLERRGGVVISDTFRERRGRGVTAVTKMPTHVVIDSAVTAAQAASALGLGDAEEMLNAFVEGKVKAVKPDWVVHAASLSDEPTLEQCWTGLQKMKSSKTRSCAEGRERTTKNQTGWIRRTRRQDEFAKVAVVKASSLSTDSMVARMLKRRREGDTIGTPKGSPGLVTVHDNAAEPSTNRPRKTVRNEGLADMFDQLSKLHKTCPILVNDEWRTYHYAVIAGRLRSLDFDVIDRKDILQKLSNISGFGDSAMTKVREFLRTGQCRKLRELQRDPMRAGVRALMKIHGVGKKKAAELVKRGYTNIDQVRQGLVSGALELSGVSLIGVECYEDFAEKMDRNEVELIGNIIREACGEKFPGANVDIMGSYRRGKKSLGDVDILITHPNYVHTTPRGALGELVNRLKMRGHIEYDLNHVEGMLDPSEQDSCEGSDSPMVRQPLEMASLRSRQERAKSVSYMGVFNSPVFTGKRRRVDIKFYPHEEKPFATVYFTGSGWFNRSMRLWATRKKQMTLNDHGFFPINMSGGAMKATGTGKEYRGNRIGACSEKEIFDRLNLEYRSPCERDCFDAVVEKGSLKPIDLDGDFAKDPRSIDIEASHVWVD